MSKLSNFFPLPVFVSVREIKQACLDFRSLPLTDTELLIFPQNIELDLHLDVRAFCLH